VFAIDQNTGRLTYVEHQSTQGSTPRNFGIDPSGTYLLAANQKSDSVIVFRIDAQSGRLTATGSKITVGSPVCVKFVRPDTAPPSPGLRQGLIEGSPASLR
jgi:6-phosphogluconolactonase